MSSWAEIDENNIVLRVTVGDNNDLNNDEGYKWLLDNLGGRWIKTSYNTRGGKHYNPETGEESADQSKALRKNYAGINYIYDEARDAFIPPKPFESWLLDEETCLWNAPVAYPQDGKLYEWNEEQQNWVEIVE